MSLKSRLKTINKKQLIIFLIIIIIAIFVRIYKFPNALKEVNSDEMMLAVNAKSIADTGKDINGISYPVYLLGFGGQSVLLLYLIVFCIKIFGYSLFAIRLPLLIISIVSLVVFYDLIRRISKNNTITLIGLGLLAISPWHILQGMWALDCNILPHILLIAVYLLYIGILKKSRWTLYLSMVFFALTLYSYGIAIYFTPILLLALAIYLRRKKKISIPDLIICIVIFSVLAMPIILMFAINILKTNQSIYLGNITIPYYESLSRTDDMLFFSPNILVQLFINIGFTVLMILGEFDGCVWNSSLVFGTAYHITLVLVIVAIIIKIKNKASHIHFGLSDVFSSTTDSVQETVDGNTNLQDNFPRFLILSWLCTSIFTGIVINQTNINRLNTIWYPLIMLATFALYYFYNYFKVFETNNKNGSKKSKIYAISIISIFMILFTSYLIYFNCYYANKVDMSICFSRGMYQALEYTNTLPIDSVKVDNLDNDGSIDIYIKSNNYFTDKIFDELRRQDELDNALNELDGEVLIINEKRNVNIDNYDFVKFGEYYVVFEKKFLFSR